MGSAHILEAQAIRALVVHRAAAVMHRQRFPRFVGRSQVAGRELRMDLHCGGRRHEEYRQVQVRLAVFVVELDLVEVLLPQFQRHLALQHAHRRRAHEIDSRTSSAADRTPGLESASAMARKRVRNSALGWRASP